MGPWLACLGNRRAKARVLIRLDRLEFVLEGHWRSVGEGVRELKIPEG
jgi:putative component of toxin-antitoxin plasmid stabilization module